jgi:spermidine synthase
MELGMDYNQEKLIIEKNQIKLTSGEEVMMDWEYPIMKKHAEICASGGGIILEVGFGMGISADYIQELNPTKHVIVESHEQIIERLLDWSKDKPNVEIIKGDWFYKIDEISKYLYDGIFFDTHRDKKRMKFKQLVADNYMKIGGIFTWFEPTGANTFNCPIQQEKVIVNPVDCGYFSSSEAYCSYIKY